MKISTPSVFGLFALMLAAVHAYAADNQTAIASNDSIRFVALPYLNAFHIARREQTIIISPENEPDLSNDQWRISATSIPDYREVSGIRLTIDTMQTSGPKLLANAHITVPLPNRAAPVRVGDMAQQPLWIHMIRVRISRLTWHAPALTPMAAALKIAEQKRKARLAERMADRAFYFGYDTNNDALK